MAETPKTPAYFITFEGGEGCGKSTQIVKLAKTLSTQGISCITTREPGGTPLAEAIRALTLTPDHTDISPTTEYLLFSAARADHMSKKITPTLAAGTWVLCDRFYDSSLVYQHLVQGLDRTWMDEIYRQVTQTRFPDLTLVLDVPPELGLQRAHERTQAHPDQHTRFEEMNMAFHTQVWKGFRQLAHDNPQRCVMIDGTPDPETVHQNIYDIVCARLLRA